MSKSSYRDKLRTQVRRWQDKIDHLQERIKQGGSRTGREFEHQIQDLRAKQKAARRKLAQLERTGRGIRVGAGARAASLRRKAHRAVRRILSGLG